MNNKTDVDQWLILLRDKLLAAFGARLLLVAHVGSWARNDADRHSDIDVNVILDHVHTNDVLMYRSIVAEMPDSQIACGFLGSRDEILIWPRHELVAFYYGCTCLHGQIEHIIPAVSRQDIQDNAMLMAANLNHAARHALIYDPDLTIAAHAAKPLLKTGFFVLQGWYLLKFGRYIEKRQDLREICNTGDDARILDHYLNWDNDEGVRTQSPLIILSLLADWSSKMLKRINEINVIGEMAGSDPDLSQLAAELLNKNALLRTIAITDELTGLYNRYYFDQKIFEEMERSDRYDSPLAMIIFDLDHFKLVNDMWGHDTGDRVLVEVAALVQRSIRHPDIFARWGGEEFVLVPVETDLDGAAILAEKLRQSIAGNSFADVGQITASFGIAGRAKNESYESWFRRADQALYQAKNHGRNCLIRSEASQPMSMNIQPIEWKSIWECGQPLIDQQHRDLIEEANNLITRLNDDPQADKNTVIFHHLTEMVVSHFNDEEHILVKSAFPDVSQHAEKHRILIEKLLRLQTSFMQGRLKASVILSFMADEVVIGHMLTEDVLFFPYLRHQS